MTNRIPLTRLAFRLRPELKDRTPTYRQLYFYGLDGQFEMKNEPGVRGYYVEETDLPAITDSIRALVNKRSLAVA